MSAVGEGVEEAQKTGLVGCEAWCLRVWADLGDADGAAGEGGEDEAGG